MKRNVVLVVLDTVRKDYFDGFARRLGSRSALTFEQCRAASSWSVPSHASIFTGELPSEHGLHAESFDASFSFGSALSAGSTVLGDLDGHRTVGISANAYLNERFGFDALFDEFQDFSIGSHTNESLFPRGMAVQDYMAAADDGSRLRRYLGFLRACLAHDHSGRSLANGVWSQVGHRYRDLPLPEFVDDGAGAITETLVEASAGEEPVFAFVNYMDAHTPLRRLRQYDDSLHSVPSTWSSTELDKWELNRGDAATPEYTSNYRELYAAAIDYVDRTLDDAIDDIAAATDRETTVIVTADHGHNLGYAADGGLFHHTGSMSEGLLHVPCVVINPPAGWAGTETRYFSQCDLRELVRRAAHGEPFDDDLLSRYPAAETVGLLGTDDGTWGLEFSEEEYAHWNRMIRVAYDGTTKYRWDSEGTTARHELDACRPSWQTDPETGVDIPERARDQFDTELRAYKGRVSARNQDMDFDREVERRLETLGYL